MKDNTTLRALRLAILGPSGVSALEEAVVQADRAEATLAELSRLRRAGEALRQDLLDRGTLEADGTITVDVSQGAWLTFCAALDGTNA